MTFNEINIFRHSVVHQLLSNSQVAQFSFLHEHTIYNKAMKNPETYTKFVNTAPPYIRKFPNSSMIWVKYPTTYILNLV